LTLSPTICWLHTISGLKASSIQLIEMKKTSTPTNYTENILTKLRRPKLQPKVWIKLHELNKYVSTVVWLTSSAVSLDDLMTLMAHIKKLVIRSGWNFAFLYLKEAQRLLIRAMSGSPEPKYLKGICVSRDSHGLPRIIPINLRTLLSDKDVSQIKVKSLLTVLSVYRVFPTKPKPSLSTIVDPFLGINQTLEGLAPAVKEIFGRSKIKLSSPKLIKLETAGPNASKSAWSSSLDALAFILYPKEFRNFLRYCIHVHAFWPLIWCVGLILIGGIPLLAFLLLVKDAPRLRLGKLGTVLDQAGKARIIAICSY